jgi:hypothetical protein
LIPNPHILLQLLQHPPPIFCELFQAVVVAWYIDFPERADPDEPDDPEPDGTVEPEPEALNRAETCGVYDKSG